MLMSLAAILPVAFALEESASGAEVRTDDIQRRLYVADRPSGVSIYNISDGHRLLRRIELPGTGNYKGIAASPQLGRLYLASNLGDKLVCIDLQTEEVLWDRQFGKYIDSPAITPDGQTLYVPCRHDRGWWVVDAKDGAVKTVIETGRGRQYDEHSIAQHGPHNTWMNDDGSRVYFELLTVPYVLIADTATNRVVGKVGPFSRGVRPFAVSADELYVYANVDLLLGFEVGSVRGLDGAWGGPLRHRVEAKTVAERFQHVRRHRRPDRSMPHLTPSHGINLTPDGKELWVVDGIYGYVYVYDAGQMPPQHVADVPLFADPKDPDDLPGPGWVSFSIGGDYAYPDHGPVIDVTTRKPVADIPLTEKLLEIRFNGEGKPLAAGRR
jgi:DNA-binding beta-propeller fold protein YncE